MKLSAPLRRCNTFAGVILALCGLALCAHAQAAEQPLGKTQGKKAADVRNGVLITLDEAVAGQRIPWPVLAGVALPEGHARSTDELSLSDALDNDIPVWLVPVSYWRKSGTLKWVHLRFVAQPGETYRLIKKAATLKEPLAVESRDGQYTIRTGDLELRVSQSEFKVLYEGKLVVDGLKQQILDGEGKPSVAPVERIEVERQTPVEVTFLVYGKYSGAADVAQRVSVYRNVPAVFFDHTFGFTGKNSKDTFRDISVQVGLPKTPAGEVVFDLGNESSGVFAMNPKWGSIAMAQERCYYLNNNTPFSHGCLPFSEEEERAVPHGQPDKYGPDHYGIYGMGPDGSQEILREGKRCGDGLRFSVSGVPVTASLKNFWQQFPKEWELSRTNLILHLWSPRGGVLDFSWKAQSRWHGKESLAFGGGETVDQEASGLQKRHNFFLLFGKQAMQSNATAYASQAPEAVVDPAAICAAHPFVVPVTARDPNSPVARVREMERILDDSFIRALEVVDLTGGYGWLEYGAGYHMEYAWNPKAVPPRLFVRHYRWFNRETLNRRHLWTMYYRSGDRRILNYMIARDEHFLDVEVNHGPQRGSVPAGSFGRGALCYWTHWPNEFDYTYHVGARDISLYLARTGDPRALWMLNQWRNYFLGVPDVEKWAREYRDAEGQTYSWWRAVCTTIESLNTLYELFGDSKLRDMSLALTLAFYDPASPAGTAFVLGSDQEYSMYGSEYFRIFPFYETWQVTGDRKVIEMVEKQCRYFARQNAQRVRASDPADLVLYDYRKDPGIASLLYFPPREANIPYAEIKTPYQEVIGPKTPPELLCPASYAHSEWGRLPYMIAACLDIHARGGLATQVRHFAKVGCFPVWVGQKWQDTPFVMGVFVPLRNKKVSFYDESGKSINEKFVRTEHFEQKNDGNCHTVFTVELPANHAAKQVWAVGDPGWVTVGTEESYLFYPGRTLVRAEYGSQLEDFFLRFPEKNISLPMSLRGGGLKFADSAGKPLVPVRAPGCDWDNAKLTAETSDGLVAIRGGLTPWFPEYLFLDEVPKAARFCLVGDPAKWFEPCASNLERFTAEPPMARPDAKQIFVEGVSGQAVLLREGRTLVLKTRDGSRILPDEAGTLEFWFKPLWDTSKPAGGLKVNGGMAVVNLGSVGSSVAVLGKDGKKGDNTSGLPAEGYYGIMRKRGAWCHVSISWTTLKEKKIFANMTPGRRLAWISTDGIFYRVSEHNGVVNENEKDMNCLRFQVAGIPAGACLVDEIRISQQVRYGDAARDFRKMGFSSDGGYNPGALHKLTADAGTLLLLHLDETTEAAGPLAQAVETVVETEPAGP